MEAQSTHTLSASESKYSPPGVRLLSCPCSGDVVHLKELPTLSLYGLLILIVPVNNSQHNLKSTKASHFKRSFKFIVFSCEIL